MGVLSLTSGTSGQKQSMTRTSGTAWDAGAISQQTIQHSSAQQGVQFRLSTTGYTMIGLSNGNTDAHYQDIDFAIFGSMGTAQIHENKAYIYTDRAYAATDLFEIRVVGTVVTYLQGGVVFYTSSKTPTFPLVVDTALYNPGAAVLDVAFQCDR
jgi:hypothetical protein